ncbi:unnamed protein product [Spirodela intermedia]|uniref:Glycosyl transferase family 1 domain-containing protein n=1 Tax=Spirodela intermedia TaxID=51605 RepID=A0A7I8JA09_SPIIN|nr:unnamed protein product [Spirodela intermedia]CAA6666282.1 unnamed protein product [Spirodela intermedia]
MEETEMDDLLVNVVRQNSLRSGGSFKSSMSGRSTPRGSPSFRRGYSGRASRRDSKAVPGRLQWIRGNRVVFWLILITLWTYIGFAVQSKWAHDAHGKDFRILADDEITSGPEKILLEKIGVSGPKKSSAGSHRRKRNASSRGNPNNRKRARSTAERRLESKIRANIKAEIPAEDSIPRRNTTYGMLLGPFAKTEDSILEWSAEKRRGTCDRKSRFAHLVWSRSFILIFHELSMTGAPLTMMELATELLSCGATVSVVAVSRQGGLMPELNRRGIKVLKDKGEPSFKTAMKKDLIIAGSAVCSSWIDQYLKYYGPGSSQIVWWIMENRREYFDRSKTLLDQVKTLIFLSESQSKQWLTWCEEERIHLRSEPGVVPLSVSDELAFVAGIPSSLNTPSFNVESMEEKRHLLREAVRKEMGLGDSDMLVMTLSSINPAKGQLLLLESILLMEEHNVAPLDIRINSLFEGKNLTAVILETHLNQTQLADGANRNVTSTPKPQKRKRRRSRSRKIGRGLLSDGGTAQEPALKVLIGSIGSKSNKTPYIKGILSFLSQHKNLSESVLWTRQPPASPLSTLQQIYLRLIMLLSDSQGLGETFGRVTIEAMAFGLPVLGTDAGGTKEIVEDKVTGLLHPVGREGEKALAENLHFLLRNATARKQLGQNGRFRVAQTYLKRHLYSKLAAILSKCMKPK